VFDENLHAGYAQMEDANSFVRLRVSGQQDSSERSNLRDFNDDGFIQEISDQACSCGVHP
jgi:hypothetical protein